MRTILFLLFSLSLPLLANSKMPTAKDCGRSFNGHFDRLDTGFHRHVTRSFRFFAPCSVVNKQKPAPVIIALHHALVKGKEMERLTQLNQLAKRHGFIVVYPNSWVTGNGPFAKRVWNDGRGWEGEHGEVDDIGFLLDLVSRLNASFTKNYKGLIDRKSLFLTGIASGASLVHRMACDRPQLFKAFAPVSSTLATPIANHCNVQEQANILMIAGTNDEFNPFCDGDELESNSPTRGPSDNQNYCSWMGDDSGSAQKEGDALSVMATKNFWAKRNKCAFQSKSFQWPDLRRFDQTQVHQIPHYNCSKGVFKYMVIKNGGHQWAGHRSSYGTGANNYDIDASKVIVRFFNEFLK
jgi:polyhydroxybutyrate depolymerase